MRFLNKFLGLWQRESRLDVQKAIVAYCYGNMAELAFGNIEAFTDTYKEDPDGVLRARLYSAASVRLSLNLDPRKIREVGAVFSAFGEGESMLLFDFSKYGGLFEIEAGVDMVAPSYAAVVFDRNYLKQPRVFLLNPSTVPGASTLLQLKPGGVRLIIGKGREPSEAELVRLAIGRHLGTSNSSLEDTDKMSGVNTILSEEWGITLDDVPDRKPIDDLSRSLCAGLSKSAFFSLGLRLVVMNYLAAAKLMRDGGESISPEQLLWLTGMVDRAVDFAEAAEDRKDLEKVTSQLNENIVSFFESFGIRKNFGRD